MQIKIILEKRAEKALERIPEEIVHAYLDWIESLNEIGLFRTQCIPGNRDKQLHGTRKGQRSVRLSKDYRLFYTILSTDDVQFVRILDINKHEY